MVFQNEVNTPVSTEIQAMTHFINGIIMQHVQESLKCPCCEEKLVLKHWK